jgi:anti-sigma B factor antagonist
MEIQNKQVNDVTILSLSGNIDALIAPKITEHISGLVSKGNIKLVADFSGVDYTSSAGLRVFQHIRLAAVQPDVLKVLNLSGFSNILKMFADVDAALASYS